MNTALSVIALMDITFILGLFGGLALKNDLFESLGVTIITIVGTVLTVATFGLAIRGFYP